MTDTKASPYQPKIVAKNEMGVHQSLGEVAQTCKVSVPRPMPCIVILVHGVNDVGEAYQNQETGIIEGLRKRLDRSDLYAHEWKDFIAMHNEDAQTKITAPGRSPVIPFYWGYKPVTRDDWKADQKRYRDEVTTLKDGAKIPYDSYQENDPKKMAENGNDGSNGIKFQNDSFKNALDVNFAKGGGTFANATTNIPDMLGPGSNGLVVAAAGFGTLYMNGGNYTHPIYHNPHRIYQFFAAQRLADLILTIRRHKVAGGDVINIVAHSQGTIITMLANMLVKQAGAAPANCVILNHSPYSLESRFNEDLQEGHHQTDKARQETFSNFCKLMATQYQGGQLSESEIKNLEDLCTLPSASKNKWHSDPRYSRNNNGKIYNYFCPVDGTVSLQNVKGFGWRGVPQDIAKNIPNLFQRVFYQHGVVGKKPTDEPFVLPWAGEDDFTTTFGMNSYYSYRDVIVNGEELPETFIFKLMGEDNHPDNDPSTCDTPYETDIDEDSPDKVISYSAKANAISRTDKAVYSLDKYSYPELRPGSVLNDSQLAIESIDRKKQIIYGVITGTVSDRGIQLTWLKTREELEKEWEKTDPVGYSQHSSIVASKHAPSHAMAFDLAIGQCKSFDYQSGKFWEALLHRADWRDSQNGYAEAKKYYNTGILAQLDTKQYMSKPDEVLPNGEFGVINDYGKSERPLNMGELDILLGGNKQTATVTQWAMPRALNNKELE
ncbi:DUF3274 domain-containing protein [Rahnella sp. Lac-M11]|uniref:DUF3274 domain-containing protein n=1 Tax=Rahnella contaminans TaxID=2703882 RepID=A0A6M2AZS3_9GAMM|nr:DUF3274 domain-containing protein [Rahnella contaminans]NGX85711.1 DUF3274 domain-containing protein [Rahnella contaminans]